MSDASVGVGVQAGPVRLAGTAHPGGQYALAPVAVINTGSEPESVSLRVARISPGTGRTVPPSWVSFPASPVRLSHNQSARIPVTLSVPRTAQPGQYFSDVVASGSGALVAGGANLGVSAATALEFKVTAGAVSSPWFRLPGWLLPPVAAIVLLAAGLLIMRRLGIRIRIERGVPAGRGGSDGT